MIDCITYEELSLHQYITFIKQQLFCEEDNTLINMYNIIRLYNVNLEIQNAYDIMMRIIYAIVISNVTKSINEQYGEGLNEDIDYENYNKIVSQLIHHVPVHVVMNN